MEFLKWTALSVFTSVLAFAAGFGMSTRRVEVTWYHLVGITMLTFVVSLGSLFMGHLFQTIIPVRFLEVLFGLGIISIGILVFVNKPVYPGTKDLYLFAVAIQLDVFLLTYSYAQDHERGYGLAFIISLLVFGAVIIGMVLGQRRLPNWRMQMMTPYLPGACLIIFGLIKVL